MSPPALTRHARQSAGLTQAQLAERLGTTQSAIARLERHGSNPRVDTLERVLSACGFELAIDLRPRRSSIDETLVARQLRLTPGERILSFERSYANVREVALAAQKSLGRVA
jgi:transcriptional regulator with XRE-family HTH domain